MQLHLLQGSLEHGRMKKGNSFCRERLLKTKTPLWLRESLSHKLLSAGKILGRSITVQLPIALLLAIAGDRMPGFYKELLLGLTHYACFHLHLLLYFVCAKKL